MARLYLRDLNIPTLVDLHFQESRRLFHLYDSLETLPR